MTKVFTIAAAIIIALADAFFLVSGRETISEFLYASARNYPIIPAAFGVLLGHLFWPVGGGKNDD
jgi:hypothetical protein